MTARCAMCDWAVTARDERHAQAELYRHHYTKHRKGAYP